MLKNLRNIIREEINDMEWIDDIEPNFDNINLRVGDIFMVPTTIFPTDHERVNKDGLIYSIVTIIDVGLRGDIPITYINQTLQLTFPTPRYHRNKVDFIKRIIKDKWIPSPYNRGYKDSTMEKKE